MPGGWPSDFKAWWLKAETLNSWDAALLLVLGMQPSEIAGLDMEDYGRWCEVARQENERRKQAIKG